MPLGADGAVEDALDAAARGFERDFSLLDGAGSYWDMTNFSAATPKSTFTEDGRYLTKLPDDYYATKTYTDKLIGYIDSNRGDGKPFFAYVAHQAPQLRHARSALGAAAQRALQVGQAGDRRAVAVGGVDRLLHLDQWLAPEALVRRTREQRLACARVAPEPAQFVLVLEELGQRPEQALQELGRRHRAPVRAPADRSNCQFTRGCRTRSSCPSTCARAKAVYALLAPPAAACPGRPRAGSEAQTRGCN